MRSRRKRYSARRRFEIATRRMKLPKAGAAATRKTTRTRTRRSRATRTQARSTWTQATTWTVMCNRSAEAITSSAQPMLRTVVAAVATTVAGAAATTVAGAATRAKVTHTAHNRAALRICLRRAPSKPHKASSPGSSGPSSGCKSTHTITTLV